MALQNEVFGDEIILEAGIIGQGHPSDRSPDHRDNAPLVSLPTAQQSTA
jgi:hypothetical protein